MSKLAGPAHAVYLWFERAVAIALVTTLMVVLTWACVHFIRAILSEMWSVSTGQTPHLDLHALFSRMDLLREVFGAFLLLLIGLELMKTVVMYLDKQVLHWDVVIPVALIAVARHTLEIDLTETTPGAMLGTGAVIVALAIAYFLLRRSTTADPPVR
jgi:uncharacterized membrane protein (DUF373 family)